jgi:phosphoheptose isomerase
MSTTTVLHERIGYHHLTELVRALDRLPDDLERLDRWGRQLAGTLLRGGRLLAVGNGGSAAQAQHLTSELVGRYQGERRPLSAIALHADTSALTAIANDYGVAEAFARQVRAHGRRDDVLIALSTSGRSENVLRAVEAARDLGLVVWAMTGTVPNPLGSWSDDVLAVRTPTTATVQEVHQVAIHLVCEAVDREIAAQTSVEAPDVARGARR